MKVLILLSFFIVGLSCYVIDFENSDGHLQLESNTLQNEPKVENVISNLEETIRQKLVDFYFRNFVRS